MDTAAEIQLVVFDLAGERFGTEIARVHEIIRLQDVTQVPRAPEYVEGAVRIPHELVEVPRTVGAAAGPRDAARLLLRGG